MIYEGAKRGWMLIIVRTEWRIHKRANDMIGRKRDCTKLRSPSKFLNMQFDGDKSCKSFNTFSWRSLEST